MGIKHSCKLEDETPHEFILLISLCNLVSRQNAVLCLDRICQPCFSILQINLLSMEHNFDMVSVVL